MRALRPPLLLRRSEPFVSGYGVRDRPDCLVTATTFRPLAETEVPVLRVEGLTFAYASRPVFERWSARFAPGLHLVCGDDGSGKTTLLRLLAGELLAQAGELQLGSHRLADDTHNYRGQLFRTDPASDPFDAMTPMQWFNHLRGTHAAFDMAQAQQLLDRLRLQEHLHKTGHMLSTGSRRKVWLAAALASNAALVLIEQPFAALDAPSIRVVTDLLHEVAQSAQRIVILADYEAPPGLLLSQVVKL